MPGITYKYVMSRITVIEFTLIKDPLYKKKIWDYLRSRMKIFANASLPHK